MTRHNADHVYEGEKRLFGPGERATIPECRNTGQFNPAADLR
ncbi:MAG: hypothetical protein PVJ39_09365 [Gammaproteobacteria bacterium]